MEQQDDEPIPYLLKLENEMETNSEKLTPKYIRQTRQKLHSVVLQLDHFYNSKLGINKLFPDILYAIFELAVYESPSPPTTILKISRVCRHWRKSALGWPTLWRFIDLNKHSSSLHLVIERSQNVPLSLSWTNPRRTLETVYGFGYSSQHFASCAKSILPRLYSLTVKTSYVRFARLHRDIQNNVGSIPIQLRYLDIDLSRDPQLGNDNDRPVPPPISHLIDNSCLQELRLVGVDSRWLNLPHRSLTSLTYRTPINPPAIPQLLVFLSNCPSLKILDLGFQDYIGGGIQTMFPASASLSVDVVIEVALNLSILRLEALGSSSYKFLCQFSSHIIPGALSQLDLRCDPTYFGELGPHHVDGVPLQTLAAIPRGSLSNFSHCDFLDVTFFDESGEHLQIFGSVLTGDMPRSPSPLGIAFKDFKLPDYSPIRELVNAMPRIRYLILRCRGLEVLTLWPNLGIRRAFPCLKTLELIQCDIGPGSLPGILQLDELILSWSRIPGDVLFDMVSRMEVKVLEIIECGNSDADEHVVDAVAALREMGVEVVVRSGEYY